MLRKRLIVNKPNNVELCVFNTGDVVAKKLDNALSDYLDNGGGNNIHKDVLEI